MKHPAPAVPKLPPDVQRLVKVIGKKAAPNFADLCNTLDLSPQKAEALIARATALGVHVHIEHNHVGIRANYGAFDGQVQRLKLPALLGDEVKAAVISDTHFGSEHCMRDALTGFIHTAYEQGVRDVFHPGDFLDGMYKHDAPGSQRYVGVDDQARDAMAVLPHLPGLRYHCITGNHDETFTKASGISIGHYLVNLFKGSGRHDLRFYGDRGALLEIHNTLVELWHPCIGYGYAKDHPIKRHVEATPLDRLPNILLIGHWHAFCHVQPRGVQAVACPTFQSGAGSYGKALGSAPSSGGLILRWQMTEARTVRRFSTEQYPFYDKEIVYQAEVA